jgi:hypothetical protein
MHFAFYHYFIGYDFLSMNTSKVMLAQTDVLLIIETEFCPVLYFFRHHFQQDFQPQPSLFQTKSP